MGVKMIVPTHGEEQLGFCVEEGSTTPDLAGLTRRNPIIDGWDVLEGRALVDVAVSRGNLTQLNLPVQIVDDLNPNAHVGNGLLKGHVEPERDHLDVKWLDGGR